MGGSLHHVVYRSSVWDNAVSFIARCTLVFSGFVGPRVELAAQLSGVGDLVQSRRQRLIKDKLFSAVSATTGAAATIAALMAQTETDPGAVLAEAMRRFRGVSWD